VVIGDTPYDVAAARAIGASSLAVCTGGCAPDRMHEAGATWVVGDLAAPGVLELLSRGETT
jgi:phosphoglycolate phosphatase-like HAD superfamily hydrolase